MPSGDIASIIETSKGMGPALERWYASPSHPLSAICSDKPMPTSGHPNIRQVNSFDELLRTPFANGVNALCWPRVLTGNFGEVVAALKQPNDDVVTVDEAELCALSLSADGKVAVDHVLLDLTRLREQGLQPELNCVGAYPRATPPVPTDVYSFHVDKAPIETDTWLCTYYGPPSEGLRNEHADRCVDVDVLRAALLRQFGGGESPAFETYLRQACYDLHFVPRAGAVPWSFGVGYLWRIAVQWTGSAVLPCIHRAPDDVAGQRRLLLIS